jgi:4-hydroxy-tetrahydrodipicolinate synthase
MYPEVNLKQPLTETVKQLQGLGVALTVPLNSNQQIDWDVFVKHVEGIDPFVDYYVLGSTTEFPQLPPRDRKKIVQKLAEITSVEKAIIVYVTGLSYHQIVDDIQNMMHSRVTAVMYSVLNYTKPQCEIVLSHFHDLAYFVASTHNVPLLAYDVPSRTGTEVLPKNLVFMCKHPAIVGIKDANGKYLEAIVKNNYASDEFVFLCGEDTALKEQVSEGSATGLVSVVANFAPLLARKYYDAVMNGQEVEENVIHAFEYLADWFAAENPARVKLLMRSLTKGVYPEDLVQPSKPYAATYSKIEHAMEVALKSYSLTEDHFLQLSDVEIKAITT